MASLSTSPSATSKKPRALGHQARKIVYNVHKFLAEQKAKHNLKYHTAESTAEATGVSRATVVRIVRDAKQSLQGGKPKLSGPKKKHGGQNKVLFTKFTEGDLRRRILQFYIEHQECPTVGRLLNEMKRDGLINCGEGTFRKKMHELGFRWRKCDSNKKTLTERHSISASRESYLEKIKEYREANRPIVYLGETYLHSTHVKQNCGQSPERSKTAKLIRKKQGLIIVHAGGEMGFIPGALLVFESKTAMGDYHGNIDVANFTKWISDQLVPNLPQNSVVVLDHMVMDNESSSPVERDKRSDTVTCKTEIREWSKCKEMKFDPNMTNVNLLEVVKNVPTNNKCIIDNIIRKSGHNVLWLPPYHPDLNPIELVWVDIKKKVNGECLSTNIKDKKNFLVNCLKEYSLDMWQKCCQEVRNIEQKYIIYDRRFHEIDNVMCILKESATSDSEADSV